MTDITKTEIDLYLQAAYAINVRRSLIITNVQSDSAKGRIAIPRGGECTRRLRALAVGEQYTALAADECKQVRDIHTAALRGSCTLQWAGTCPPLIIAVLYGDLDSGVTSSNTLFLGSTQHVDRLNSFRTQITPRAI